MERCEGVDFDKLNEPRQVPTIREIDEIMRFASGTLWPYCYGGNTLTEAYLGTIYEFRQANERIGPFRSFSCRGFDSSGLVHYISNGYLPHNTSEMLNFGQKLFAIATKNAPTKKVIDGILSKLMDTDLIIFTFVRPDASHDGNVIMSYKMGFVESRGPDLGFVKTHQKEAESRLTLMYNRARAVGSNLYVIRWHPELLAGGKN
jgi:hypothetical protein